MVKAAQDTWGRSERERVLLSLVPRDQIRTDGFLKERYKQRGFVWTVCEEEWFHHFKEKARLQSCISVLCKSDKWESRVGKRESQRELTRQTSARYVEDMVAADWR
jgi:hypothetical protein